MQRAILIPGLVMLMMSAACAADGGTDPAIQAGSTGQAETSPNDGGFGDQVGNRGEFAATSGQPLTGTVRLESNGCWLFEINGERRVMAFPHGFSSRSDDPAVMDGPGDRTVTDGDPIDAVGQVVPVEAIPGGFDSRYGNLAQFCGAGAEIAVLDSLEPAYDPATSDVEDQVQGFRSADFSRSWPCGHRFAVSTDDQRLAVVLDRVSDHGAAGTVQLPDDSWTATILVGKFLFAQNCDDAVEQWESSSAIAATWPLTAGRFEFAADDGIEGCGANPVSTTLVGGVVETPTGPVELPAIVITNEAWGCFAG